MPASLEWFGCTTFRVRVDGLTLWFDTYLHESVGTDLDTITNADYIFISHAHFDHVHGCDVIAGRTGAHVVGNFETMRLMRERGVPEPQLLPATGGELLHCSDNITVRVFPSLHSCLFATPPADAATITCGDLAMDLRERRGRAAGLFALLSNPNLVPPATAELAGSCSEQDGGQLAYLLETPAGSLLISASTGCWSGVLGQLRPDVAILAVSGRPHLDGEPYQGSLSDFIAMQAGLLGSPTVIFCHHDAWLPQLVPALDTAPVATAVNAAGSQVVTLSYGTPVPLFG